MPSRRLTAVLCSAYILCVLVLSYSLPFSFLFPRLHSTHSLFLQAEKASQTRSEIASEYFEHLQQVSSSDFYLKRLKRGHVNFAIGIITVKRQRKSGQRENLAYIKQSASLIDRALRQEPFFNNSIPFICNVDKNPGQHLEAVRLYKMIPYIERFGSNSLSLKDLKIPQSEKSFSESTFHSSVYHKETLDYSFCLLSASKLKAHYVLLVEDDALPHRDFAQVLKHILESRLRVRHYDQTGFAFLKLFYPPKWQGFSFQFVELTDLLSLSVVGAVCVGLPMSHLLSRQRHSAAFSYPMSFSISFLLTIFTCWLLGRQNVNELRRISPSLYRLKGPDGCCTQAMLYPNSSLEALATYLVQVGMYSHTDLSIMDYLAIESHLPALQVEPNLFYHAGLHTTLSQNQKHPQEFLFHL